MQKFRFQCAAAADPFNFRVCTDFGNCSVYSGCVMGFARESIHPGCEFAPAAHLVLFTNDSFASSAENIAFGTLFPNTNETTLITELTSPQLNPHEIFALGDGDALSGPNDPIGFEPGSPFEAIAFSGGQIIGSGTSSFTYGVSEPPSWTMVVVGFAGLGFAGYRRTRKTTPALAV
jgi:hypothetical protein